MTLIPDGPVWGEQVTSRGDGRVETGVVELLHLRVEPHRHEALGARDWTHLLKLFPPFDHQNSMIALGLINPIKLDK